LSALVERAAAMAREAPEDPDSGLAPEDRLMRGQGPDIDADDGGDPSPVALRELVTAIEESARAVPGVTNSEGAGIGAGRMVIALATSAGFARAYTNSSYSASARQLGLETTGHAARGIGGSPGVGATNVHMEPGAVSPSALIAGIKRGVYVTEMIGQGVNAVTGDYSRGASGFVIENGEIGAA